MSKPSPLDVAALTAELSKLPRLTAAAAAHLDPTHQALAHAVATGQSADELASAFSVHRGLAGLDLTRATVGETVHAPARTIKAETQASRAAALPGAEWIAKAIPATLQSNLTTRVAILDREPTALGGLEGPGWARALKPTAVYGPVTAESAGSQIKGPKWVLVYTFTETVEFVRSGKILCVLPLSSFHVIGANSANVLAGSAWVNAHSLAAAAPSDAFAGLTIQSGKITSSQPLVLNSKTVTLAANASITLTFVPAPTAAGPSGFPAATVAPGVVTVHFPASGAASISFDHCSANIFGQALEAAQANVPAVYNAQLKLLYIPGTSAESTFSPVMPAGKILSLKGSAPIVSSGWAVSVSESATPATLGTAINSGDFALAFGAGISCRWKGINRFEPAGGGMVVAQNQTLLLATVSASAKNTLVKQTFKLWPDQDSSKAAPRACQLVAGRLAGQILLYALAGNSQEVLELTAGLEGLVDRPLLATGARVPAVFAEAIIAFVRSNASYSLLVYSATPFPVLNPVTKKAAAYPLALDNALLDVSQPAALLLIVKTDATFAMATEGLLFLVFGYRLVELFLPDPYTGGLTAGPTGFDRGGGDSGYNPAGAAFLAAEVGWTANGKVSLRLGDMAHDHPANAPTSEAGSAASVAASKFRPTQHVRFDPVGTAAPVAGPARGVYVGRAGKSGTVAPIETVGGLERFERVGGVSQTAPAHAETRATTAAGMAAPRQQQHHPTPPPMPATPGGATLIDLSTRASQLGVEVITSARYASFYTIDGISVRGPAALLPLTTLPAIAWEPMFDKSSVEDDSVDRHTLLHPPDGDGPLTQLRSNSATLIPISPLQSLQSLLHAPVGGFEANITLPFGMVGFLDSSTENNTVLPHLKLVRPSFAAETTPAGTLYTGAWQLSINAPDPTKTDAVLAGRTYLRSQKDNPDYPGYSYGEQVLGADVADIFSSRFDPTDASKPGTTGVPLRRYDLTGYGATTFSEWTNVDKPRITDVIKAHFHVLIGRTSREVIQVQSIICPWAIKVVRTITIDRLGSGSVERYDSGWQAGSDGTFDYPDGAGIKREDTHSGLISGVIAVKNIQQIGIPVYARGTRDFTGYTGASDPGNPAPDPAADTKQIPVQPVTFDADVVIQSQHLVTQGGMQVRDLNNVPHVGVASKGITGYIPLEFDYHLSLSDMAAMPGLKAGASGAIKATINVGEADHLLRATEFDATPINDVASNRIGIVCAVRGIPKLSSDGAWSVASRNTKTQSAPVALAANAAAPVVQPNTAANNSTPGGEIHFADPADLFRLAHNSPVSPANVYGFLQATGSQSNFLSRPVLSVGNKHLKLADALNVAHAGALLGAISKFPGLDQCIAFAGNQLTAIQNKLEGATLATRQQKYFTSTLRENPVKLIDISVAQVDLAFHWMEDTDPTKDPPDYNVIVALGQKAPDPSWLLEVNRVAVTLTIPALSSDPLMWLQGGFHADADHAPAFPDLKVKFAGPLDPLTEFFTVLQDIAKVLSPGGSSGAAMPLDGDEEDAGPGLKVHFADGKLTVTDNFSLPNIPLGPGTISDVSLDIGASLDILGLMVSFGVSIGTKQAPCHWIVDPLSGTIAIGAGVKNNALDIFIEAGIGLGLAIDLGIASGSASIVIAVSLEINGNKITIMLLLTGQAQVDVLGGLASASISLTAGLGLQFAVPPTDVNLIGTASVGIHISICWVVNINFSGSWTFQKDVPLSLN